MEQLFLRREFGLALGADLAHENVVGTDPRANADNAVFIKVPEHLFGDVGNVAGEFLATEFRLAHLDIKRVDVNRGEHVGLHQTL